jgi:hypothetical protein
VARKLLREQPGKHAAKVSAKRVYSPFDLNFDVAVTSQKDPLESFVKLLPGRTLGARSASRRGRRHLLQAVSLQAFHRINRGLTWKTAGLTAFGGFGGSIGVTILRSSSMTVSS